MKTLYEIKFNGLTPDKFGEKMCNELHYNEETLYEEETIKHYISNYIMKLCLPRKEKERNILIEDERIIININNNQKKQLVKIVTEYRNKSLQVEQCMQILHEHIIKLLNNL